MPELSVFFCSDNFINLMIPENKKFATIYPYELRLSQERP